MQAGFNSRYACCLSGARDGVSDRRVAAAEPLSAAQRAAQAAQVDRQKGAVSAERARLVEEYRERQRQAMLNKVHQNFFQLAQITQCDLKFLFSPCSRCLTNYT